MFSPHAVVAWTLKGTGIKQELVTVEADVVEGVADVDRRFVLVRESELVDDDLVAPAALETLHRPDPLRPAVLNKAAGMPFDTLMVSPPIRSVV